MSTTLTYDLTYDAPAAQVHAMLMDPAFREQVCDAQGAIRKTVTIGPEGGGQHVVVNQVLEAEGLPGFARKIVGDEINLVQTEQWSADDAADLEVVIPGKPGQMSGTIRLIESGGSTTETVDIQIKVSVPLVGGKIESLVSRMLEHALRAENEAGRRYLAG